MFIFITLPFVPEKNDTIIYNKEINKMKIKGGWDVLNTSRTGDRATMHPVLLHKRQLNLPNLHNNPELGTHKRKSSMISVLQFEICIGLYTDHNDDSMTKPIAHDVSDTPASFEDQLNYVSTMAGCRTDRWFKQSLFTFMKIWTIKIIV